MMLVFLLTIALAAAQTPAQVQERDPAAELASARQLYASAAYEEALDRLNRIDPKSGLADQADTYRALCLLALGRSRESEQVVERILTRNPRYTVDEREVSPRLLQVFRSVRTRLLPSTARTLYTGARSSLDAKQYDTAIRQFREVIDLLGVDPLPDSAVSDLKMLAEDFLKQAENAKKTASADPDSTPRPGANDVSAPGVIYSILDRDVIPPVETSRPMPIMDSPRGEKPGLYQGLIEIVIGESGRVEQVAIRKPIHPTFDSDLIASTGYWRFQPATKNGKPVKFRRSYEVIGHSR